MNENVFELNPKVLTIARGNFVKPAISFHQKISMFTLRCKFLRPVNGKMKLTAHSNLLEVDPEKRVVEHEIALLSLMQLVHRRWVNNIDKVVLIENVSDTIIWTYYGKLDRYPFDCNFHTTPEGDTILNDYSFYKWSTEKNGYELKTVNIMRDHFRSLQEKINLNLEWHKAEWRKKASDQAKREMAGMERTDGKGAIEIYNVKKLSEVFSQFKTA